MKFGQMFALVFLFAAAFFLGSSCSSHNPTADKATPAVSSFR